MIYGIYTPVPSKTTILFILTNVALSEIIPRLLKWVRMIFIVKRLVGLHTYIEQHETIISSKLYDAEKLEAMQQEIKKEFPLQDYCPPDTRRNEFFIHTISLVGFVYAMYTSTLPISGLFFLILSFLFSYITINIMKIFA